LNGVVHVEAALRLPDQPQVRVVHHDVHVRQVELGADGEFFDHELEVVVAG
jgi:hypothetical protein